MYWRTRCCLSKREEPPRGRRGAARRTVSRSSRSRTPSLRMLPAPTIPFQGDRYPYFTRVRGRGVLRTSPVGGSGKFFYRGGEPFWKSATSSAKFSSSARLTRQSLPIFRHGMLPSRHQRQIVLSLTPKCPAASSALMRARPGLRSCPYPFIFLGGGLGRASCGPFRRFASPQPGPHPWR